MKWYFVRFPKDCFKLPDILYAKAGPLATWKFPEATLTGNLTDAIALRNTLPDSVKKAAEIWSLDDQKMKFEKLKL